MFDNSNSFLKKALGEDYLESLLKFEIWKPGTKTTLDHEEIKTALQIVPRTIMALVIRELSPMAIGDTKEIKLPVSGKEPVMNINKLERDVFSGNIVEDSKIVTEFKFRSIPGVALIIMSAFELYSVEDLKAEPKEEKSPEIDQQVGRFIDERLALHDLINKVVDQKMLQKDAVQTLVLARMSTTIADKQKKVSPLKAFLEKKKKPEFSVEMAKGESVHCPDCRKNIFDGKLFSGCICLGDDMERKVFIKKTESGVNVRFSKGWDEENISMLLEVLRSKNARE